MSQNGPSTPSRLQAHSRHLSNDGGTEFGTPESNFPGEAGAELGSPTLGESTRMVGLGISRQGSVAGSRSGSGVGTGGLDVEAEDDGDVFGGFTGRGQVSHQQEGRDRDSTLDEVDQFLQDEEDEEEFNLKHDSQRSRPTNKLDINIPRRNHSSHSSLQSTRSHASDPLLEVLDNDEDYEDGDEGMEFLDGDEDEEFDTDGLGGRRSRRGRRRWNEEEGNGEAGLLELIPPLILAHPLAIFPILAYLPFNFLPAGVVFFIPVLSVLAVLSACAQIVIVYLSWYLKVSTFEEIFASVAGRYGQYGLWAGRAAIIVSTTGMCVSWLGSIHPLLAPVVEAYFGHLSHRASRLVLTIVGCSTLLPSLLPSRMTRSLRRAPFVLALMLPIIAFIIVGRTVEIERDRFPRSISGISVSDLSNAGQVIARALSVTKKLGLGLSGTSSAGAGFTTLTLFLSPHLCTLSTHSQLARAKRTSFPLPALASSMVVLLLSLPAALVPYYLMPTPTGMEEGVLATPRKSGVLARYPDADLSINVARCFMAAMVLGSCNMWILRGRDTILRSIGVDRGEAIKAGKWVGVGFWVIIVSLVCLGGWVSEKLEILGVIATISISWLLPSIFFIITFHVRSPLSIVFPSKNPPPAPPADVPTPSRHSRTDSMTDPTQDVLLARKERQLQKRRLGRRLWQDLIVYIGILPVGCITIAWSLGKLVGLW